MSIEEKIKQLGEQLYTLWEEAQEEYRTIHKKSRVGSQEEEQAWHAQHFLGWMCGFTNDFIKRGEF